MNVPGRARRRRRTRTPALAGLVLFIFAVFAERARADSLLPLQSETATTLASGHMELVLGTSYFRDRRFPAFTPAGFVRSQHLLSAPELGLRVAAGKRVEIRADFDFLYLDEETADGESQSNFGNGDLRLFTKIRLFGGAERWPAVGLRFGTKLPNANRADGLGTDETDFHTGVLISKDFGPLAAHANLGLSILGNPGPVPGAEDRGSDGQDDLFTYSVALASRPLARSAASRWSARLLAEVTGQAGSRFDNDRTELRGGAQIRSGGFVLYAGASAGLVTASENFGLAGGLVYDFELERLAGLVGD